VLRDHLLLSDDQLGELRAVDEAARHQDLAELGVLAGAALGADRLGELVHADHLQVDGQSPQERRGLRVGHAPLSSGPDAVGRWAGERSDPAIAAAEKAGSARSLLPPYFDSPRYHPRRSIGQLSTTSSPATRWIRS
jgi:hypothetical protein